MPSPIASATPPGPLRPLLTLARRLLQTDDADTALTLAGQALVELARVDAGLLVVRGNGGGGVEFDREGTPRAVDTGHDWYPFAAAILDGSRSTPAVEARLLGIGLPDPAPAAALVVQWADEPDEGVIAGRRYTLAIVLELAVAALGRIHEYAQLASLVGRQRAQLLGESQAHAAELARRDVLESEMRVLSLTDMLTGLHNRRGFFVHAEQVFKVARRRHAPSAVLFADVDHLKLVNDQLGHDAGDHLIRDAAEVFRASFRSADVVGRLGGDEFVAYTLEDAQPQTILARLQDNLNAFNLMQERPYRLSLSAGIVSCEPDEHQSLLNYVVLADQQMYANKRSRLH
ncbi:MULTISPECIES: diguanylate cyclase [unclassified Massilia]|uniref:GGDEF domain-containing protein n=1 Tax=unclassified Massilia TaxID=2609279 RepID=UPI001B834B7C|nr:MULTISPECIES: GGDEF domain-containing protein [unclassified Massilia]MBQ5939040.1 GGDEF domain-containing protein [Massilia sp. AB1]MBQ5962409.1 GGDEF domain-containing protein [Massilia sp. ZL223]